MSGIICPMHPGVFLKEAYMEPTNMTIKTLSESLGISCKLASDITEGKEMLTDDMLDQLSYMFKRTFEGWMFIKTAYVNYCKTGFKDDSFL